MKKTRKLLSILLALVMALSLCTVAFAEGEEPAAPATSGKCGENVTWSYKDAVLTISGTGPIVFPTHIVDGEYYVDGYYEDVLDGETGEVIGQNWVNGYWTEGPHEEEYAPWGEAADAAIYAALGVESMEEFYIKNELGNATYADLLLAASAAVKKVVVGEGVTSIPSQAFYRADNFPLYPQVVVFPASLTEIGFAVVNAFAANRIVFANPELQLNDSTYLSAFTTSPYPYGSFAESMAAYNEVSAKMANAYKVEMYAYAVVALQHYIDYIPQLQAAIAASEDEEEKAALQAELDGIMEEVTEGLAYLQFESVEAGVATILAFLSEVTGLELTKASDVGEYVLPEEPDGEPDVEYTEAFETAAEAFLATLNLEELEEEIDQIMYDTYYWLGDEPPVYEIPSDEPENPEEPEEPASIELVPAPWITVYGYAESTAKTAAETSKVKFVSLEDDKAAFDALKADAVAAIDALAKDGDSDASKKILDDAKTAVNAAEYDITKNVVEAKPGFDAIVAQAGTDVAAQREADKPVAPEEKPDDKPADNDKDEDGGYSNNAFMKFIKKIIEFFKGIFDKITGIFKK